MLFTVIVLTLNEERLVRERILEICAQEPQAQIIAADGGSQDGTLRTAAELGVQGISARRGRGSQCRAGAAQARGDILLFLHADTCLPADAFQVLRRAFSNPDLQAGTFRLRFDHPHPLLRLYAYFARFDSVWTRFGDQGIAVRREFYEAQGGFPEWPLFEDVDFLRAARRASRVVSFPTEVTTSARRYLQNGVVRQQLINGWLMIQYLAGVPPETLAQQYNRSRQ